MPPALFARVTDRWWTYEELAELIDRPEPPLNWQVRPVNPADLNRPPGNPENPDTLE